jgi:hypothetical protein
VRFVTDQRVMLVVVDGLARERASSLGFAGWALFGPEMVRRVVPSQLPRLLEQLRDVGFAFLPDPAATFTDLRDAGSVSGPVRRLSFVDFDDTRLEHV